MDQKLKTTLDAVIKNCDLKAAASKKSDSLPFTIWIPKGARLRYDQLQSATKLKFGSAVFVDVVREVIVETIGCVQLEDETPASA